VLQCVAVCCSVLQCVAVCCSVLQCVAACCSVLQCVAVCCSVNATCHLCDSMCDKSHSYVRALQQHCQTGFKSHIHVCFCVHMSHLRYSHVNIAWGAITTKCWIVLMGSAAYAVQVRREPRDAKSKDITAGTPILRWACKNETG